jgi:hypothetical protein
MLIAMVGKSGAGKDAAAGAAEDAFKWTGIMGEIDNRIERVPIGSGEGLVKSYATYRKNEETKQAELSWRRYSVIITIEEIDTFRAIRDRSGSTITGELRKFYSGGTLGFGYSDDSKRIVLPKRSYRGCVIAGVQPGRGEVIIDDVEGGFAQRWLWLPATDPGMPDERPPEPAALGWEPPGEISNLSTSDGPYVMRVCEIAAEAVDRARVKAGRGHSDDMESHMLYTRLKVAAGLALLDGCDMVRTEDWELSGYVMKVSARTRELIRKHLSLKAHEANVRQGRAEGVRREVAESTVEFRARTRVASKLLARLTADAWTSLNVIKRSTSGRIKECAEDVLDDLAESGRIESREVRNQNGRMGKQYRKIRGGKSGEVNQGR